MNIRQILIIALAIAINVLVLASFHAWTVATVASARPPARADRVITLPVINVHPSAAEWRALHATRPPQSSAIGAGGDFGCVVMPFYSFAAPCTPVVVG